MDQSTRRFDNDERDENTRRITEADVQSPDEQPPACPKCSGERIWSGQSGYMVLARADGKGYLLGKGMQAAVPLVCLECGYVELFVKEPRKLITD